MGIIVFIYIFILTRIVSPEYYAGMKPLASYFRSQPNEVAFTSPIDYTVGLYYMDKSTIRLVNPKEPENSYEWWPFVDKAGKLENPKNAFFITPDPQRMTEDYVQPLQNLQFGNYQVWVKKN
ncbi:MAG: hypothetical protein ACD_22C00129G0005 [uncultured bacterium]|nr:MAG: hypothetical protein ACD_22C00129G0005 [uncultured bacterium]